MKWFAGSLSVMVLSVAVLGAEPITFNPHAFSTNDPVDSMAAEAAFLTAVAAGGFATFSEDFDDPVWEVTRSPNSAELVTSHGITWHSSAGDRMKTTEDSDSYEVPPPYMIYAHDPASGLHPAPNTLMGESATTLHGIGFWADGTGTKGKIQAFLDDVVTQKFQRIVGYEHNPPDPPEPIKETVRLAYTKEFYGVYAQDGFSKFQLLEFAGEPDEIILMWMRTFTFAYRPPVSKEDIHIIGVDYGASNLQVRFTSTPVYSNLALQANSGLSDPLGWTGGTNAPTVISQNVYRVDTALPPDTRTMFRIINTP